MTWFAWRMGPLGVEYPTLYHDNPHGRIDKAELKSLRGLVEVPPEVWRDGWTLRDAAAWAKNPSIAAADQPELQNCATPQLEQNACLRHALIKIATGEITNIEEAQQLAGAALAEARKR